MTFNDILAEVQNRVGRPDAAAQAKITLALNSALRQIEGLGNWYWMEQVAKLTLATGVDQGRFPLPVASDPTGAFKELRDSPHYTDDVNERQSLDPISEDEANDNYATDESGEPERYRIWKQQLFVYPPKRDVQRILRVPYWAWSPAITGSQTNVLASQFPELWIVKGTIEYFRGVRDFKAAAIWNGNPKAPEAGTFIFEMAELKRTSARQKMPRFIGVSGNAASRSQQSNRSPWWPWRSF